MSGDMDFFEGSEKLLEIWWNSTPKLTAADKEKDLRCIPRQACPQFECYLQIHVCFKFHSF